MDQNFQTNERQRLHELQQFVLNRKTADIRFELYEHMICYTINEYALSDGTLSYQDLIKKIESHYNIKKIPTLHLDSAIEKLMESGNIDKINQRLSLTQKKRSEIKKQNKKTVELENNLKSTITSRLKEGIPKIKDSEIELIISNLSIVLGTVFANYGSVAAKVITEGLDGMTEIRKRPAFQEIYNKKILNVIPKPFHNDLDKIFNDLFYNPTEDFSEYLFSMAQSYVFLEVLNLDPELKKIQKISWSKKHVYLDTNTLLSLLFEGGTQHASIYTLIKQTQELGAQLLITQKTAEEYEIVIENSKEKHQSFKIRTKFGNLYGNAKMDNDFFSTYAVALQKTPGLSIDKFAKKYEEYEKLIETQYSMQIEPIDKSIDLEDDAASRLKVHLSNQAIFKFQKVLDHDAYNILRIHKLRKEGSDETGPKAWLLTTDYSLPKAERDMYGKKAIFASVNPEIWLQIISPFLSPELAITDRSIAFSKMLSSNFKSHKMNIDDFANLLTVFMDDTLFTNDQVRIIMGSDYIQEKMHEMKGRFEKGEEITLEQFEPIMREAIKEVKNDYEQKIAASDEVNKKKFENISQEVTILEDKISELTAKEETTKKLAQTDIKKWKFILVYIICAAVFDALLGYGLSLIPNFIFGAIVTLAGVLGIEAGLIFLIIKIWTWQLIRKTKSESKPWSRSEILTLIGIIITGVGVTAMVILALLA